MTACAPLPYCLCPCPPFPLPCRIHSTLPAVSRLVKAVMVHAASRERRDEDMAQWRFLPRILLAAHSYFTLCPFRPFTLPCIMNAAFPASVSRLVKTGDGHAKSWERRDEEMAQRGVLALSFVLCLNYCLLRILTLPVRAPYLMLYPPLLPPSVQRQASTSDVR
ncbi:hypothetical protein DFJ77DRAFT_288077 [Powellomyces hirtus]|nr:hypothetical protein DFJ77DRAFT_288077 [Powellomyces hirtus]